MSPFAKQKGGKRGKNTPKKDVLFAGAQSLDSAEQRGYNTLCAA